MLLLIPGFPKCGTTSCASYLGSFTSISVPKVKETHFFDRSDYYRRGRKFYYSFFDEGKSVWCDPTPSYMVNSEKVLPRILQMTCKQDVRCIVLVRPQVERIESLYRDILMRRPGAKGAIDEIWRDLRMYRINPDRRQGRFVRGGLYSGPISAWKDALGAENVHVGWSTDFRRSPSEYINAVGAYLGVRELMEPALKEVRSENAAALPRFEGVRKLTNSWPYKLAGRPIKRFFPNASYMFRLALERANRKSGGDLPKLPAELKDEIRGAMHMEEQWVNDHICQQAGGRSG